MNDLPPIELAAIISFALSGALSICFGLFSVIGTLMGGMMAASVLVTGDAEGLIGVVVLVMYGLWMVVCLGVGSLHLWAAFQLVSRRPKGTWLWVAAGSGLLLALTVYCAPFGMFSAALGAIAMFTDPASKPTE